jgi:hypothetical protein
MMTDVSSVSVFGETNNPTEIMSGIDNHVTSLIRQIVRFFT